MVTIPVQIHCFDTLDTLKSPCHFQRCQWHIFAGCAFAFARDQLEHAHLSWYQAPSAVIDTSSQIFRMRYTKTDGIFRSS